MTALTTLLATFAWCVASAVVPVINSELYLLAVAAAVPRALAVPLIVAATLGQMVGKSLMYFAGRGVLRLPGGRMKRIVGEVDRRYQGHAGLGAGIILLSASLGFPPFYIVAVACGLVRVPFARFLLLGAIGRFARFAAVVLGGQLAGGWWA
ncbi:MAG: VTT domain-containing protein [Gemmatimonadota bacterium]|nr:VTT domain-containing protein [Gemmatimonadota bacterium]